jgi:hypothetical protein
LNRDSIYSFNNELDILGTYASYSANVGKWGLKGGVRYEYPWLTAAFNEQSQKFKTDYVFVPREKLRTD